MTYVPLLEMVRLQWKFHNFGNFNIVDIRPSIKLTNITSVLCARNPTAVRN